MALATALAIAAIPGITGGSPSPMTPRWSCSGRMSSTGTISPKSQLAASL
jgi:hypothetical protein